MSGLKNSVSLGVVIVVVIGTVLGVWFYTMSENRSLVADVTRLKSEMIQVRTHMEESQKLYEALNTIKQEVRSAREQVDQQLDESYRYSGNERMEYLMQLLEADLERRADGDASCFPASGVRTPQGVRSAPDAGRAAH